MSIYIYIYIYIQSMPKLWFWQRHRSFGKGKDFHVRNFHIRKYYNKKIKQLIKKVHLE